MKKQKKFFTVVPLQEILYNADGSIKQNKLTSGHYQPVGNSRLEYGDTKFPIIPVFHGYAEPEDLIQVVAITPDNPFAAYHLEELRQEAIEQANRYAETETVKRAVGTTKLHKIVVVYKGMDMPVCEEV